MIRWLLILLFVFAARPLLAAESAPVTSPRLTATLVSDTDTVAAGQPMHLGLRLRMAPGWHTYWQNPGDAGEPPGIDLTLPSGAKAGGLEWPAPERLAEGPVMTFAYTGEIVLPIAVTPGSGPLSVQASAHWLVCSKICVPEEGKFTLDLPAGTPSPSAQAPLFQHADALLPRPSPFAARIAPDGTLSLAGEGLAPAMVQDATFFPASWGAIDMGAPQTVSVGSGVVRIGLKPGEQFSKTGDLAGIVVLRDPAGQETVLQVDATPGAAPASDTAPLARTLLLAVAGGLLLNLMPCVFPVLAMKAMALARTGGKERRDARGQAIAYTAGVLVTFVALGAALLAARAAGQAAGWGFQFQSPLFVAAMAWLLFLVGLNLSGVFEVSPRFAGAGQGLAGRGGWAGSFFTGLLAVLVATPCTAPFMGAALAAALAAPAWETVLVFAALGVGMALPYLLLGLFPGWARILPRPGRWMDILRGALAFPMYGATVWLIWVLSVQSGSDGVLAALAGLVLLGFAAWALGLAQRAGGRGRLVWHAIAVLGVLAAGLPLTAITSARSAASSLGPQSESDGAEPYSADRLAALRAEGRPVFVNMTAAWCVTCLVNEKVALSPGRVREAFAAHKVAYLKGDWTSGDKSITDFLRAHDRDGVPLYLFYAPGQSQPTVLPQILTEAEILSQFDKIGG